MEPKRKQHILPKSYLKYWVDPSTLALKKTPMVWTISKDGQRGDLKSSGESIFWRDYFYDLISVNGERNQVLENSLSKIENAITRIG